MTARSSVDQPRRILMTVDAVGGVWRYAMDLGRSLAERGTEMVFAVFGPPPTPHQLHEAETIGTCAIVGAPLDWMVEDRAALAGIPERIATLADRHAVDLVHLNLPTQAAGLELEVPVVAVSHSCVVTWFRAVRGADVPAGWAWQHQLNAEGLAAADAVVAPSHSHARMLEACYGPLTRLRVVHNASRPQGSPLPRQRFVLAAARWWDEGKNARTLDAAAAGSDWPVRMAGALEGPSGERVSLTHAQSLGELPGEGVHQLMARAGIVVSTSLYEPFGLAALEGALGGAALVLSDIATYRELWDGAALFAPATDPDAFRHALNRLARDADLRVDLRQGARTRALQFSPAAQATQMRALYGDLRRARTPLALVS